MAHKDKTTRQVRLYLRPQTILQLKALTLITGRDDWNVVCDDMIQLGIAYANEKGKLELAEWQPTIKLLSLDTLKLRVLRGDMSLPENG